MYLLSAFCVSIIDNNVLRDFTKIYQSLTRGVSFIAIKNFNLHFILRLLHCFSSVSCLCV